MDLTPYVESLRHSLTAAAEAGGTQVREAADRLAYALDPAARLALMEALSQAAAEITAELPTGGVDVVLHGRELDFVVDLPASSPGQPAAGAAPEPEDNGDVVRVSLRLPENVKTRAEELADSAGQSLNTWLVAAVRAATHDRAISVDIDLSSVPFLDSLSTRRGGSRRMSGWV